MTLIVHISCQIDSEINEINEGTLHDAYLDQHAYNWEQSWACLLE